MSFWQTVFAVVVGLAVYDLGKYTANALLMLRRVNRFLKTGEDIGVP